MEKKIKISMDRVSLPIRDGFSRVASLASEARRLYDAGDCHEAQADAANQNAYAAFEKLQQLRVSSVHDLAAKIAAAQEVFGPESAIDDQEAEWILRDLQSLVEPEVPHARAC